MTKLNCPNCGTGLNPSLRAIKLTTCPSCSTALLLEDEQMRQAGTAGVMHDTPMLFGLSDTIIIGQDVVKIHGHARYSYGRGFWDEFWGLTSRDQSVWVSVDEGDIILQKPISKQDWPVISGIHRVGRTLDLMDTQYTIIEANTAECIALRGCFDEELHVGETYQFVNLQSSKGELISGEFWQDAQSWYNGCWVDPFELKVTPRT